MIILQVASFFLYMKSGLKVKRRQNKKRKIKRKKLQFFFCLDASTWRDEMPLIKVAYLMLIFLNLKSFLSNLFFAVASSLSTLWDVEKIPNLPKFPLMQSPLTWFLCTLQYLSIFELVTFTIIFHYMSYFICWYY